MQVSFKKDAAGQPSQAATLLQLKPGEIGILDRLDVPDDVARRLMELGFLPGHAIRVGKSAPGGDPRVFRVDGSEIALRLETAARLHLRPAAFQENEIPGTDIPGTDCP